MGTEITLISMRVRIRAPSGQHTVELDAEATVGDLKALIAEQAGVAVAALRGHAEPFRGGDVAVVLCGANVSVEVLREVLA